MSINRFIRRLVLSASLLCAGPVLSAPAAAPRPDLDPAIWVVKDRDTTIYLFGTVHALDGKSDWFNDEVKTAFDASQDVVLEIVTPENQAEMMSAVMKYGIDKSGRTLTSQLSPEGKTLFAAHVARSGLPLAAFDRFKPFFAAITLSTLDMSEAGMAGDSGVEKVLTAAAKASRKPVGQLETIEFQLSLFDALPQAEQLRLLEKALREKDSLEQLKQLVVAWGSGKADLVAKEIQKTDADSPALYKALIIDRNVKWAYWVKDRLTRPGTTFVAVGAGHLAGPDSVQSLLKRLRIKSKRVKHRGD